MKRAFFVLLVLCTLLCSFSAAGAASVSDFTDVNTGDWFYSNVAFVTEKGMFTGTSANTFSPYGTMTRGMFVTVLGRYGNVTPTVPSENAGIVTKSDVNMRDLPTTVGSKVISVLAKNTKVTIIDEVEDSDDPAYMWYYVNYNNIRGYIRNDLMERMSSTVFSDVPADEYYAGYVYWAYNTGVAGKTGADTFSPNVPITREEICSMMYNYAMNRNLQIKAISAAINFTDKSSISSAYTAAVTAMQRAGVVTGYDDGSFRAKNSATRAEVSALLSRFIDCISYKPVVESSLDGNGNYIWGTEVPKNNYVNSSYFSDACFIGHSITVGMSIYLGLSNADFFAFNGATTKSILSYDSFAFPAGGSGGGDKETGTLAEVLDTKSYGKVYIMLGTNEAGVGSSHEQAFKSNMSAIIDLVRKSQPNAKIYLFSLTPVTRSCSEGRADLSRDNIIRYNAVIKQLCKDKRAYYLNVFDHLVNSDGFLPENAALSDGIHLLSSQYSKIKEYIFMHTA